MTRKPKLKPIPSELIIERLRFENPWWQSGIIDGSLDVLPRRQYCDLFFPLVAEIAVRRAVVLMGPRRVGKTVMLYHAIQHLLTDRQVLPSRLCFISIDNPIYLNIGLGQLLHLATQAAGSGGPERCYVFFDEIQYLKDWEVHLKVLVDSYPQTKFIVSGSAAAALKLKSRESGAGRFTDFMLPPLTFHEYIHMKRLDHLMQPATLNWQGSIKKFFTTHDIEELNKHFLDYINFGGYPEMIFSKQIQADPSRYIKSDIVDKVLLRDLPSLYGIRDVQELNAFFTTLVYYSGQEVSLDSLSTNSGVEKSLLNKYLQYLEAAFLIRVINRVDHTAKRFKRKVFYKVFLTNPSLRSALFSPLQATDDAMGPMVETAVFAQWFHRQWFTPYYARWSSGRFQGEVDMVGLDDKRFKPIWAVEVKWSNRMVDHPVELKSLFQFCKENGLSSALVTTIDRQAEIELNGLALSFVPAAIYAYVVGLNTLEIQKK
jgi:hypothetical protein